MARISRLCGPSVEGRGLGRFAIPRAPHAPCRWGALLPAPKQPSVNARRQIWFGRWAGQFLLDAGYGLRSFRRNPIFASVAVASLALAIGAATSVFSVINAILLGSLPVPNPQDLRVICWSATKTTFESYSGGGSPDIPGRKAGSSFSWEVFQELRGNLADKADLFGFYNLYGLARAHGVSTETNGLAVSGNFFSGLGVKPMAGTLLGPEDEKPQAPFRAVLSYGFWERIFARDPNAIGQTLVFNGHTFVIAGVLPPSFTGVESSGSRGLYTSITARNLLDPYASTRGPSDWWLSLMGRLRPGVKPAELGVHLDVALKAAAEKYLENPKAVIADGRDGPMWDRSDYRHQLQLLLMAVAIIVAVSCLNLAGLLLARGSHRHSELAIRGAIGAGRGRLVQQLLTESTLLSLLGGLVGGVLALWGRTLIAHLVTGSFQRSLFGTGMDLTVLSFAFATTVLSAALAGLYPALKIGRLDPLVALRRQAAPALGALRPGQVLVGAQIALSLLLVAGTGLYLRTLVNLVSINPGFEPGYLVSFDLDPRNAGYPQTRWESYFAQEQRAVAALPGVRSVALASYSPLGWSYFSQGFSIPQKPNLEKENSPVAEFFSIDEGFFRTLSVPILLGRDIRAGDERGSLRVAVVNETLAQKYFPGESPIGQSIRLRTDIWQIVGVCRDLKGGGLKQPAHPMLYLPYRQFPTGRASLIARTDVPPSLLFASLRKTVEASDPKTPPSDMSSLLQKRDRQFSTERMFALWCGSLALLALMLSSIGLYGMAAYEVSRRTREFGLRIALGASPLQVVAPVVRHTLVLAGSGVGLGLVLVLALTRIAKANLYGVRATDPFTLVGAAIVLVIVALAASWIPVRRATQVDPMVALRSE